MSDKIKPKVVRCSVYIDGFNLYFGLRQKNWSKYYWLDIWRFADGISNNRELVTVKYFTANISGGGGKANRQQAYLNALRYHQPKLEIIKGKYLSKTIDCNNCLQKIPRYEEKMTDVNIATQLLNDAWKDVFDVAIIVSGDSDLVPPIATIKTEFPNKGLLVGFPPLRQSTQLRHTTKTFYINEKAFKNSQLPNPVVKPDGSKITRPANWS